jgi:hypothetical protein
MDINIPGPALLAIVSYRGFSWPIFDSMKLFPEYWRIACVIQKDVVRKLTYGT